jgi:hypothetical protein
MFYWVVVSHKISPGRKPISTVNQDFSGNGSRYMHMKGPCDRAPRAAIPSLTYLPTIPSTKPQSLKTVIGSLKNQQAVSIEPYTTRSKMTSEKHHTLPFGSKLPKHTPHIIVPHWRLNRLGIFVENISNLPWYLIHKDSKQNIIKIWK